MKALVLFAPLTLVVVACEILFPGRDFYHYGWFNVALAAHEIGTAEAIQNELEIFAP